MRLHKEEKILPISHYIWAPSNMNKRLPFLLLFIFGLIHFLSAQNRGKDIPFRMSIRANATIPHSISNKAFRRSFTGIYDIAVNFNYQILHGFNIGFQYRINEWKTADNKIAGLNTYAQANHGGIRVGYDVVRSERSTGYIGLAAEQGMIHYFGLSIRQGTDISQLKRTHFYHAIDVDAVIFFYTEGNFAIGVNASGIFTNYHFDPYSIFLNQYKAYIASDLNGTWAHINIGFTVVYSFWRTKGTAAE